VVLLGCIHHDAYAKVADKLAIDLLGLLMVRQTPEGVRMAGRILETEAYLGPED